MQILITGATGFIGRHVAARLRSEGHTVHEGISPRHGRRDAGQVPMDFARDTDPGAWLPRLAGIDAVVNAVGVLRDSPGRPIDALHRDTPIALFQACAQAGVRRVVQISALGVDRGETRYARTKRGADTFLLGLAQGAAPAPSACVLRPSIVFGRGGASSALFMNLARLPVVVLPRPVLQARVQPVAVHDLADAVAALLGPAQDRQGIIECAGPEAVPMAGLVASLRAQCGHGPARVATLPDALSRLSARLGDRVPASPWCSESLALLGSNNTADPAPLRSLLGREAVHYRDLVARAWRQP
ncbi:NAD-dependent epimerase/dehydratase family protein [Paracidovorax citrulli]|uniref:NAD-dependent epimerase/dehydratase n=2 Tax=Paracidovorax citrulli TaxID=80869 RepID=A1TNI6_PARC0|nr:NAD-dependent epimerase/dehydratase family protein [Paracidovorax citrulli]ABM32524.1 NAD-dependent epimerase/dehydratase [Paracidovorax citrulli AAC00-1]ATG93450.1 epimerase [Paracidovorax citrulli]MVT36966.1 NAD-dependent epimerase/dehydratase family protein [Paracidovorax citrulli]PVY66740.1 nucleoside-diphosphate-sugar epimerase [Paracidovorax citrulli]REG69095.1 nucleoside-diphosphate-sugar epimerase [Paracidovorax citrulli]